MCQGWDAYGYSCYWMEETTRSWSEAQEFCKGQGGFMLHIGDMWATLQILYIRIPQILEFILCCEKYLNNQLKDCFEILRKHSQTSYIIPSRNTSYFFPYPRFLFKIVLRAHLLIEVSFLIIYSDFLPDFDPTCSQHYYSFVYEKRFSLIVLFWTAVA